MIKIRTYWRHSPTYTSFRPASDEFREVMMDKNIRLNLADKIYRLYLGDCFPVDSIPSIMRLPNDPSKA